MFTKEQLAKWRSMGFEFDDFYDEVAVKKEEEPLRTSTTEDLEALEGKYAFQYNNDPITVNGIKYDFSVIYKKISTIKDKIKTFYKNLSDEEKVIIELPLIQWKLNYKHGAVMVLHWLEGSKKSINLDYSFFISEERVNKVDIESLKGYFKFISYLSIDNIDHYPSNTDSVNYFLFNTDIPSVRRSLDLFLKNFHAAKDTYDVGNYDNLATYIDEKVIIKDNYFQSFSIGSATGDMDDVGTTLGRYSFRLYFKGRVTKPKENNPWTLDIFEVAGRFVDEFSFNDDPKDWRSQGLGCWSKSHINPDEPSRFAISNNKVCLQNKDFANLRETAKKNGVKLGGDFLIYSRLKTFKDNFVSIQIPLFKK